MLLEVLVWLAASAQSLPTDCASMHDLKEMKQIENVTTLLPQVLTVYRSVQDVAQSFQYQSIPTEVDILSPAMVVILGAHSTGKSSLINVILQQTIQEQGLAPLHDSFTVFQYSDNKELVNNAFEKAGCDVLRDHNSPFHGLWKINHFCSKFQERHVHNELLKRLTLVDSPGMIDGAKPHKYSFADVVTWFADKADLILFMYEPGQPATVKEANDYYRILNAQYSQKLVVLLNMMNKYTSMADLSKGLHGFGSQLGRLEDNKDTKQIYYTYFCDLSRDQAPVIAMEDFKSDGEKVLKRILDVPIQHGYSTLSHLQNYLFGLNLHLLYVDYVQTTLARTAPLPHFFGSIVLAVVCVVGVVLVARQQRNFAVAAIVLAVAVVGWSTFASYTTYVKARYDYEATYDNFEAMNLQPASGRKFSMEDKEPSFSDLEQHVFASLWSPGSTNNAAYLETQWRLAREYTYKLMQSPGFARLPPVRPGLSRVNQALNESVPYLYSLVNLLSPTTVPRPRMLQSAAGSTLWGDGSAWACVVSVVATLMMATS